MSTEKRRLKPWCITLTILLVLLVSSAGCINMIKKSTEGGNTVTPTDTPPVAENNTENSSTSAPAIQQPVPQLTPMKSNVVVEVTPYTTPDPYPIIQGVRINSTPQYDFLYRQPEFSKTYTLSGNAVGLLVNVVQGPLYIVYTVHPKYDCLNDPDSCRGTVLVPVNNPYMTITVRDNQTKDIVAEDGYAREYSSDLGNYPTTPSDNSVEPTVTNGYSTSDTLTTVSEPSPRYIPIYKEGQFQITVEGDYLDVTISIITGASPDLLTAQEKSASTTPTPDSDDWD
jgi:hypothetical protein